MISGLSGLRMRCRYCNEKVSFLKSVAGSPYCSKEHERKFQETQSSSAFERLREFVSKEAAPPASPLKAAGKNTPLPVEPVPTPAQHRGLSPEPAPEPVPASPPHWGFMVDPIAVAALSSAPALAILEAVIAPGPPAVPAFQIEAAPREEFVPESPAAAEEREPPPLADWSAPNIEIQACEIPATLRSIGAVRPRSGSFAAPSPLLHGPAVPLRSITQSGGLFSSAVPDPIPLVGKGRAIPPVASQNYKTAAPILGMKSRLRSRLQPRDAVHRAPNYVHEPPGALARTAGQAPKLSTSSIQVRVPDTPRTKRSLAIGSVTMPRAVLTSVQQQAAIPHCKLAPALAPQQSRVRPAAQRVIAQRLRSTAALDSRLNEKDCPWRFLQLGTPGRRVFAIRLAQELPQDSVRQDALRKPVCASASKAIEWRMEERDDTQAARRLAPPRPSPPRPSALVARPRSSAETMGAKRVEQAGNFAVPGNRIHRGDAPRFGQMVPDPSAAHDRLMLLPEAVEMILSIAFAPPETAFRATGNGPLRGSLLGPDRPAVSHMRLQPASMLVWPSSGWKREPSVAGARSRELASYRAVSRLLDSASQTLCGGVRIANALPKRNVPTLPRPAESGESHYAENALDGRLMT